MMRGGRACQTLLLDSVLDEGLSTFGAVVTLTTRLLSRIVYGLVGAILIVRLAVDAYRSLIVAFDLKSCALRIPY
jgi:hypothetical protein